MMHPSKKIALECAPQVADRHVGPNAPGTRVLDTRYGDFAYIIGQWPRNGRRHGQTVVVYEDDPTTAVSCGNQRGRWRAATNT